MSEDCSSRSEKKKESSQTPTSEPIGKNAPEGRQASDKPTPVFEAPDSWSLLTGCFDPHSINDQ